MAWRNMRQRLSNLVFNLGNLVHISSSHMYNAVNQCFSESVYLVVWCVSNVGALPSALRQQGGLSPRYGLDLRFAYSSPVLHIDNMLYSANEFS